MAPSATVLTPATNSRNAADTSLQPQQKTQPQQKPNVLKEQPPSKRTLPQSKQSPPQVHGKKISRRSSKPIINWFQRKLAGTVRNTRRISEGAHVQAVRPESELGRGKSRNGGTGGSRPTTRVASSPLPTTPQRTISGGRNRLDATRRTISLNGDDEVFGFGLSDDEGDLDRFTNGSSLARESTWSPTSALEADEDASVRPIPPSAPPSPSPSRSSSSYLSDPRTFRSMAASTKPTTLLSVDITPNGMAHIAQVPATPISSSRVPAHVRTSSTGTTAGLLGSGASITFSALPPSPQSSRPSSPRHPGSINSTSPSAYQGSASASPHMTSVQAPLHTAHHPRNNPRPSSPPLDNASVLTLASSAFAMPGIRMGVGSIGWGGSTTPSALGGGDSVSHFGGSIAGEPEGEGEGDGEGDNLSQFAEDDERLEADVDGEGERDVDASVRALRPRSSRRGSWGSETSGWSAGIGGTGTGTSLARDRSLWTSNSIKTGGQSRNDEVEKVSSQGISTAGAEENASPTSSTAPTTPLPSSLTDGDASSASSNPSGIETTPKKQKKTDTCLSTPAIETRTNSMDSAVTHTPDAVQTENESLQSTSMSPGSVNVRSLKENHEGDEHSIAATDNQTDVWHSAPSTPMI